MDLQDNLAPTKTPKHVYRQKKSSQRMKKSLWLDIATWNTRYSSSSSAAELYWPFYGLTVVDLLQVWIVISVTSPLIWVIHWQEKKNYAVPISFYGKAKTIPSRCFVISVILFHRIICCLFFPLAAILLPLDKYPMVGLIHRKIYLWPAYSHIISLS